MPKWEYCEMEIHMIGPNSADLAVLRPDGKHEVKHGPYGDLIAQLGFEGWELVTGSEMFDRNGKRKQHLYFKRALDNVA
ncbi:MAG: hypothetical protein ACOYBO_00970 [Azonexus sp.]